MPTVLRPPINPNQQQTPIPATTAPVTYPTTKPKCCTAEFEKDGSLTIMFSISPEMAKRFVRQACGRDLAQYLWDSRGLRHFEHQPLI